MYYVSHVFGSRPAGLACPNAHWTVINNAIVTLGRFKATNDQVIQSLTDQLNIDLESKITAGFNQLKSSAIFDGKLDTQRMNDILEDNKKCKTKRFTEFLRKECTSLWLTTKMGIASSLQLLHKSMVVKSTIEYAPIQRRHALQKFRGGDFAFLLIK